MPPTGRILGGVAVSVLGLFIYTPVAMITIFPQTKAAQLIILDAVAGGL